MQPKNAKGGRGCLDGCVPKATRYATKCANKIFDKWQSSRKNKEASVREKLLVFWPNRQFFTVFHEMRHVLQPLAEKLLKTPKHDS